MGPHQSCPDGPNHLLRSDYLTHILKDRQHHSARDPAQGCHGENVERTEVDQNARKRRVHGGNARVPVEKRDQEAGQSEDVSRRPEEKRVSQAETIDRSQPVPGEWARRPPHNLDQAKTPARALHDVLHDTFGCEPLRERLVEVHRSPTRLLQTQGYQKVLGDAVGRKSAYGLDALRSHHRRRATAECDTPGIATGLKVVEEKALLVGI